MRVQTKHVRKGLYEQARPLNALPSSNTSSPLLHICAWRCWPLKFQGTSNGSVPDLADVANLFWICLTINYSHWTGRHVVLLSFFGSKNNTGTQIQNTSRSENTVRIWRDDINAETKNRGKDGSTRFLQEVAARKPQCLVVWIACFQFQNLGCIPISQGDLWWLKISLSASVQLPRRQEVGRFNVKGLRQTRGQSGSLQRFSRVDSAVNYIKFLERLAISTCGNSKNKKNARIWEINWSWDIESFKKRSV